MKRISSKTAVFVTGLLSIFASGALSAEQALSATYVKPGVDLAPFARVMVTPIGLDHLVVLKPAWEQDNEDEWRFGDEDKAFVEQLFMDTMKSELQDKGGYPLVADPGPDVLRIEVELLNVTPHVAPGTRSSDSELEILTLGSGDVTVSAAFRDSRTRELLALIEGERTIGEELRPLSRDNHVANLRSLFAQWGARVRDRLDAAREQANR